MNWGLSLESEPVRLYAVILQFVLRRDNSGTNRQIYQKSMNRRYSQIEGQRSWLDVVQKQGHSKHTKKEPRKYGLPQNGTLVAVDSRGTRTQYACSDPNPRARTNNPCIGSLWYPKGMVLRKIPGKKEYQMYLQLYSVTTKITHSILIWSKCKNLSPHIFTVR